MLRTDFSKAKGKCGIYAIQNKKTGDRYVGQSKDIGERFKQHIDELINGIKGGAFQDAWDSYGPENFEFITLRECSPKHLDALEQSYIGESSVYNKAAPLFRQLSIDIESLKLTRGAGVSPAELTDEDLDELDAFLDGEHEEDEDFLDADERLESKLVKKIEVIETFRAQKTPATHEKACLDTIMWLENEGRHITRRLQQIHGDAWWELNATLVRAPFFMGAYLYRKEKRYTDQIAILKRWQDFAKQESLPSNLAWDATLDKMLTLATKRQIKEHSGNSN